MAEEYGFFNAVKDSEGNYDRTYEASSFSNFFSNFIGNGVYYNPTNQLKVVANSGLSVTIRKGKAFIDGYWYILSEDTSITVSANDTSNEQTVVVTCMLDLSERKIIIGYRKGDSTPVNTGTKHELVLAIIKLGVGVSSITNSMIQDTRPDSNYCGYVTNILGEVDFTETFEQFENEFETWFNNIKNQLSTDQAGHLQVQIDKVKETADTNKGKVEKLEKQYSEIIDYIYPVGSLYKTKNSKFDPNVAWKGTWKRVRGVVAVGVDENDDDFKTSGKTGGTKRIEFGHSHNITEHSHKIGEHKHLAPFGYDENNYYTSNKFGQEIEYVSVDNKEGYYLKMASSGKNNPVRLNYTSSVSLETDSVKQTTGDTTLSFTNLQPYKTYYFWERVS